MTARVGIELSPSACRIVEIDRQLAWGRSLRETRVRSFAVLPPSGLEPRTKLQSLRRRTAAVVVWNAASEHRQVVVTGGPYESMRAEALAALAAAGVQTHGVLADIAPLVERPARGVRHSVVIAIASASELSAALQPLRDAGIHVRSVTTPALALASLARQRRAFSVPGVIEAYVALEETATCIALVRDSALVAARELPWGYAQNASGVARRRDDIAARLAGGVIEFVAAVGGGQRDIGQVCICGGLPELRNMTLPLMERLDVEVEPLDSMFGVDAAHVPEPADEFRERIVELRLAWAAAADWPPPINLLRAQRRSASKATLARAAVAAGVVASLAAGWRVEQGQWWQSTASKPRPGTATNDAPRGRAASPAPAPRVTPPPDVGARQPPAVTPPTAPPVAETKPSVAPPPRTAPAAAATNEPASRRVEEPVPPRRVEPPPARTEPPMARSESPAASRIEPPPRVEPSPRVEPAPPRSERDTSRPPGSSTPAKPAPQQTPPFDAVLGTILYSSDRKLAIIDGRIVGLGDEVRGARVTDITPTAVLLTDAQGRLRRLTLTSGGR